jgi:hypothetical protein
MYGVLYGLHDAGWRLAHESPGGFKQGADGEAVVTIPAPRRRVEDNLLQARDELIFVQLNSILNGVRFIHRPFLRTVMKTVITSIPTIPN